MAKVKLPFRYPGGKYYALKKLRPFWENLEHDEYREPFLGGGAVFWDKEKVKYNWINDKDPELIHTLEYITKKENRDKLIKEFNKEKEATKNKHKKAKNMNPKTDFERAFRYYYLNRTSYSGKMINPSWGYRPKRSLPPYRWKERIIPCGKKLNGVKITNYDFQKVISSPKKGERVLMFLDPPYFDPVQEHYNYSFNKYDHKRLASLLKQTNYYFILTYDDCKEIRKLYKWANIYELNFFYRMDNSNDNNKQRKKGEEIVITNYSVEKLNDKPSLFEASNNLRGELKNDFPKVITHNKTIREKIKAPLRYPGSKYRASKYIIPFLEDIEHDEYREPFFGGGGVFFRKPIVQHNWINDKEKELMFTYYAMKDQVMREELCNKVKDVKPTKEYFNSLQERRKKINELINSIDLSDQKFKSIKEEYDYLITILKSEFNTSEELLDIVFRYFVINRTAYSGIMNSANWGYSPKKSVQPYKWPNRIKQAGRKLEHTKITAVDYKKVIKAPKTGNQVLLYLDPPYFKADQKRAYVHSFIENDHYELASLLYEINKNTEYKFCLSYDNCSEIRKLYDWANINDYKWRYHTANSNVATRKLGKELIITNY